MLSTLRTIYSKTKRADDSKHISLHENPARMIREVDPILITVQRRVFIIGIKNDDCTRECHLARTCPRPESRVPKSVRRSKNGVCTRRWGSERSRAFGSESRAVKVEKGQTIDPNFPPVPTSGQVPRKVVRRSFVGKKIRSGDK